jgi:hypothetical protein
MDWHPEHPGHPPLLGLDEGQNHLRAKYPTAAATMSSTMICSIRLK